MGWAGLDANGNVVKYGNNQKPLPMPPGGSYIEADSMEAAKGAVQVFNEARQHALDTIDSKTRSMFDRGLVHSGSTISFSLAAQSNLQDLQLGVLSGRDVFPQPVSTINGGEYEIVDLDDFTIIGGKYKTTKTDILDGGRSLRQRVLDATDIATIESIVEESDQR